MKTLITMILLGMIVSPVAFAKMENVDAKDFPVYVRAIREKLNFDCDSDISKALYYVTAMSVDRSGAQPAIFVRADKDYNRWDITLGTSPDQQNLTKAKISYFYMKNVNRGSLVSPKYVYEWVLEQQTNCKKSD